MEAIPNPSVAKSPVICQPGTDHPVSYWTHCHDADWVDFMQEWWGNTQAFSTNEASRVIRIRQRGLWNVLLPLHSSNGMVFVRQEFIDIYNRLALMDTTLNGDPWRRGVIIHGNPGIGKSYCTIYALLRRLALGKPTAYVTPGHWTYWFDEGSVYRMPTKAELDFPTNFPPPEGTQIFCLADAPPNVDANVFQLYPLAYPSLAIAWAAFTSADPKSYSRLVNRGHAATWVLNPWSAEELVAMLKEPSLLTDQPLDASPESVATRLHSLLGGVPSDVKTYLADPQEMEQRIENAVAELCDTTVAQLPRRAQDVTSSHRLTHAALLISRSPHDPEYIDTDRRVLRPRGEIIFAPLLQQLARLPEIDRRHLMGVHWTHDGYDSQHPLMRFECHIPLWDYVFRACATYDLSQPSTSVPVIFSLMDARRDDSALHFTYTTFPRATHSPPHAPTLFALPLRPRTPRSFEHSELNPVIIDPNTFYYSIALHNPLFDAFFFHCYPEDACASSWTTIELYVLRMVTGTHRSDPSTDAPGFRVVEALRNKVLRKHPNAAVKIFYVLVAPVWPGYPAFYKPEDVQWDMDLEAFDDVPGEVYVQYLKTGE